MTRPRIVFAGTPEFAARHLDCLLSHQLPVVAVYTQPDRPRGRGKQLQPSPVKERALAAGIPVYQPATLRDPEAQQQLSELDPDLLVVVAYGLLLPQAVLDIPRLGCINVHASLLPRWRGAAPIQHAILAGDRESGISIMRMEAGLDTGAVLARRSLELAADETAGTLHDRLVAPGCEALLEVIDQLEHGTANDEPQDESGATYAGKIMPADARIDWRESAASIDRRVRAYAPVPGAWFEHSGERFKVFASAPVELPVDGAEPGTIERVGPESIDVETGRGLLRIRQIQPPGKRAMPVADFLRGSPARFRAGERLESPA